LRLRYPIEKNVVQEVKMDTESGPIRCDSNLSMIKIQPVNGNNKNKHLFTSHKFSDPEIEELYQLHSANQKRTELFRCFLYAILFYCVAHIITYSAWISTHNNNSSSFHGFHDDHIEDDGEAGDPIAMQIGKGNVDFSIFNTFTMV